MARHKLSDAGIRRLDDPGIYSDGDGLFLRVRPGGSRQWFFIYRRGGKRVELGLGGYGRGTAPVSLSLAREKAETIRQKLARGIDPREQWRPARVVTFKHCMDELLRSKEGGWSNGKHRDQWHMTLTSVDDFALGQRALAKHLRAIAEAVRAWDNRDLAEARARGDRTLSRTLFEHDLASIAAMLEGSHHLYQLELKGKRGKSSGSAIDRKIDRKIEIVRYIDEVRRSHPRGGVGKGQLAAMAKYNISEGTAKAIWRDFRHVLIPGNEEAVPFFAKLVAKGLATVSRGSKK